MHPLFPKAAGLTEQIIGAAIEVHRDKGPGLVESIYEWCLLRELELRKFSTSNQCVVRINYKGYVRDEPLRFDVLVEGCILVETKAVEQVLPIHKAQLKVLALFWLVMTAAYVLVGFAIVHWWEPSAGGKAEARGHCSGGRTQPSHSRAAVTPLARRPARMSAEE